MTRRDEQMAAPEVGAIILWSARLEETVRFYRALGIPLEEERHDEEDPVHWACDLGPVHFAVFEIPAGRRAPAYREDGATAVGFAVPDADAAVEAVRRLSARVVREPEDMPWGRRAIVEDPDGRPVEAFARP
jgi:lactoylglutathione lyase